MASIRWWIQFWQGPGEKPHGHFCKRAKNVLEEEIELEEEKVEEISEDEEGSGTGDDADNNKVSSGST